MKLALGVLPKYGHVWSVRVDFGSTPFEMAKDLKEATMKPGCCEGGDITGLWPDEILVIICSKDGPVVEDHYAVGTNYPREGEEESFTTWKDKHVTFEGLRGSESD